jgi:putative oxidoreductase
MKADWALLVLRLAGLGLALGHGWGKVAALSTGQGGRFIEGVDALGFPVPAFFALAAALSEFLGGICVALGLGTRIAASFAAVTMFVAGFLRHRAHAQLLSWVGVAPASEDSLKAWGNPELALVYLAVFVAVALLGPGRLALDPLIRRR